MIHSGANIFADTASRVILYHGHDIISLSGLFVEQGVVIGAP